MPDMFTIDAIISLSINAQHKLAEIHNASAAYNFEVAVKNALEGGHTPPASYEIEVVNDQNIIDDLRNGPPFPHAEKGEWVTKQAFTPPPPPPPPPAMQKNTVPVGGDAGGGFFLDTGVPGYGDGAIWTDSRGAFQKIMKVTPFGTSVGWKKIG